jgi:N,N-dimethylformamidase
MRILGYVSDEMYVAIPNAIVDFESADGTVTIVRSSPRGALYGDLAAGPYRITLSKNGFGSKIVRTSLGSEPFQFRLLSDGLLGYMWPKWVRAGEQAEFRVHSVEQYQLSLWRYGLHKECMGVLGWYDEHGPKATVQLTPDCDYTQTGVQWNKLGYGSPDRTRLITAPERGGLYYLWAKTPSGREFSFPWVVAPARPHSKIAVLAGTNTWNAYNNFGGRSNYVNADHLPNQPIVNARLELDRYQNPLPFGVWRPNDEEYAPLSFERPEPHNHLLEAGEVTDPVRGRVQCGQAPGEWRLLGWLEREGYAYDLYAEAQLHEGKLPLDDYRVLILPLHPEYWTREMYLRAKRWVFERGGRLLYLGGNGLNCEVTLEPEGAMRCLTHVNSLNGEMGGHSMISPVIEYESRMHRTLESEANFLGVVCTSTGLMTAAPYRVLDQSHWAFDRTGLRNGDLFGKNTLHERVPGGASGHETDKRSASSPADTRLLAKGINPENGGAEIVYHEPGGGGAVFSVGSITWVSGLLVDEHVSRITRNVLDRFLHD